MSSTQRGFSGLSGFAARFRRKVPSTETAGTSGTLILAGMIVTNEKNQQLASDRYQTYSDMLVNVDIIGASVRYFLNLGGKATWTVVPADDTPAAEDVAEFVDEVINDMRTPFYRVVRRALMQKWYGFSVQEWTAKRREDGKIGLLDIEPRPQHTIILWDTDEHGHVLGMVQQSPLTSAEIYLPRSKVVYVVDDSLSDSPEGLGIFRHMTRTAQFLMRYEDLEKFGFENDLRGIPKARIPYQALQGLVDNGKITAAEKAAITAPLEAFVAQHLKSPQAGIAVDSSTYRDEGENRTPSGTPLWDMELLTGGSTSLEAVANAIERLQRQLARLAGTEGLLLGGDKVGSLALSEDKSQNFAVVIDSALTELKETFDQDIIGTIMELNGIPDDLWPSFKPEQIQYRSIDQLTKALLDLSLAGAPLMPDDPAVDVIRELAGLPPQPDPDLLDLNLRTDVGGVGEGDVPNEPRPGPDEGGNIPDPGEVEA